MKRSFLQPAFIVCALSLLLGTVGLNAAVKAFKLYLRKLPIEASLPVRVVPAETESWKRVGNDAELSADVVKTLGTENYLTRVYAEKNPAEGERPRLLELHLAYYTGMVDTVPHIPERCMVGGGFQINTGSAVLPLRLDTSSWRRASGVPADFPQRETVTAARLRGRFASANGKEVILPLDLTLADGPGAGVNDQVHIRITEFSDPKSGAVVYAGYFFIANGRMTSSAEGVRLLAFNLSDDYAYYLKVQFSSWQVRSAQELADQAGSLLSELLPEIMRTVPDWVSLWSEKAEARREGTSGATGGGVGDGAGG